MASSTIVANAAALARINRFTELESSGDYNSDCQLGRRLAEELIEEMSSSGFAGSLGHIVRDLVWHGTFGPIQTGFFQCIAEYAIG
jgi:hypothetical protein